MKENNSDMALSVALIIMLTGISVFLVFKVLIPMTNLFYSIY